MMKTSINFKLMLIVILAVSLISVSIVAVSSYFTLEKLGSATNESNEQVARLLTRQFAGNILFGRTARMEKDFAEFSDDPHFHFAYGGAVRLNGVSIAENSKFNFLPKIANELGRQAIAAKGEYLTRHVGSVMLVAVPAFFGKDRKIVGALVMGWDQKTNTELAMRSAVETAMIAIGIAFVALVIVSILLKIIVSDPIRKLTSSVGDAVDRSVHGDFSKRVPEDFSDAGLQQVATSVNELLGTVDSGITQTGEVLSAMARADLTKRVEGEYQGAFAKLKDDTNSVADHFSDIIGKLRQTSSSVRLASNDIRGASTELSSWTELQAAAVEEAATSIEQITATVKISAANAEEAGTVVERTITSAEHSGIVVGNAVEAMSRIENSSAEIEKIIGVIEEISFQTNLLALNAGVEAARAGDAGRGFAVVAQEVRELAQRSANAAKEIKSLIMTSGEQVMAGVKLVNETGSALEAIVVDVQLVHDHVKSIVEASREQSEGLQEINVSITEIDKQTQKNATMVDNANGASLTLTQEVSNINQMLQTFEVSGSVQTPDLGDYIHGNEAVRREPVARRVEVPKVPQRVVPRYITPREQEQPMEPPVRELNRKVARAFEGNIAVKTDEWENF